LIRPGLRRPPAARASARAAARASAPGWRLIAALGITQTVGYGVLWYAFAVFLVPVAGDLHVGTTVVAGALTLAVLVSAAAAVPVGGWLDRRGGHGLMTAGSVLGTAAVLGWSRVHSVAGLYVVFVGIGLASAMVLYEPAFAVLVTRFGPSRRAGAVLAVTVIAGFASSIFLPLTGFLVAGFGWRRALLVLAAVHGVVTVPLHAFALRGSFRPLADPAAKRTGAAERRLTARRALRDRGYWLLVVGFVSHTAATATISVHLVAYLTDLGHPARFAAALTGTLGVLSVTGRVVVTGLRRVGGPAGTAAGVFAMQALAIAALPLLGRAAAGAIGCVLLFGLGFGVATIARPALLTGRYGTAAYATLAGVLTLPSTIAKAGAPLAAAAVRTITGSYTSVMVAVGVACAVAAGCLVAPGPSAVPAKPEALRGKVNAPGKVDGP
jgi:MFS family permease